MAKLKWLPLCHIIQKDGKTKICDDIFAKESSLYSKRDSQSKQYTFITVCLLLLIIFAGESTGDTTVSLRLESRNAPEIPITAEIKYGNSFETKIIILEGNYKPQTLSLTPSVVRVKFYTKTTSSNEQELDLRNGSGEAIYDFKNKQWHQKLANSKSNSNENSIAQRGEVSASVEVTVVDAADHRPINGATVHLRSDQIQDSANLSTRFLNVAANSQGKALFDSLELTGRAIGGKAAIGSNGCYRISVEASAEGYETKAMDVGVLVFSRPNASATLLLKTGFRESWIENRIDEKAAKGLVEISNLPQDNATSWPVVRVLVQDQRGRAIEGANVYIHQISPDKTIQVKTNRDGAAVFTPRDFLIFRFANQEGRAIMRGNNIPGKQTKSEEYSFELMTEADGFIASSMTVYLSTFAPLAKEVFHLQPQR